MAWVLLAISVASAWVAMLVLAGERARRIQEIEQKQRLETARLAAEERERQLSSRVPVLKEVDAPLDTPRLGSSRKAA